MGNFVIYFDNAASSVRSAKFVEEYCKFLDRSRTKDQEFDLLVSLLHKIANYLDTKPEHLSLVPNATYGLNEIAYLLKKTSKINRVFISNSEHSSNHLIWLYLYSNMVSFFPLSNHFPDSNSPSIYSFSLTSNLEGISIDLNLLNKKHKEHIFVADASQYMQHKKISLSNSCIDYLVFTAHKFFGPNGLGVVYSKNSSDIGLNIGNFYEKRENNYDLDFAGVAAWLSVWDEIASMYDSGIIQSKEKELNSYFLSNFPKNPYVELHNKDTSGLIFLMIISDPHLTSKDFCFYLQKHGVLVRSGLSCSLLSGERIDALKSFRASLNHMNSKEEIDYFFNLIKNFSFEMCF